MLWFERKQLKPISLWNVMFIFLFLFTACCFSGIDCCNPNLSKLSFPELLGDYFPSEPDDTLLFSSSTDTILGIVKYKSLIDTTFFEGDECSGRPGEYFSYQLYLDNQFIFNASTFIQSKSIVASLDLIEIPINCFADEVTTNNWADIHSKDYVTSEMNDALLLDDIQYQRVIHGTSSKGNFSQMYIADRIGLVAFEYLGNCYYIKR